MNDATMMGATIPATFAPKLSQHCYNVRALAGNNTQIFPAHNRQLIHYSSIGWSTSNVQSYIFMRKDNFGLPDGFFTVAVTILTKIVVALIPTFLYLQYYMRVVTKHGSELNILVKQNIILLFGAGMPANVELINWTFCSKNNIC